MNYKLLLLDVDGTLVDVYSSKLKEVPIVSPQVIKPKVIDAIKKIKDNIHISLCTGRSLIELKEIIETLNLKNEYHVIESGSKVTFGDSKILYVKDLQIEVVKSLIHNLKGLYYGYSICEEGIWKRDIRDIKNASITTLSLHSKTKEITNCILDLIKLLNGNVHAVAGTNAAYPEGASILITNKEASKSSGVGFIQNKLNITIKNTICIGDMMNDLPLFNRSGFSCAMGNAPKELKGLASFVTTPVSQDGVALVVEKFLINSNLENVKQNREDLKVSIIKNEANNTNKAF